MNRSAVRCALVVLAAGAMLTASLAEAQFVMLARRAIGRVEQMSQQQPNGGAAYDSAAVMIEVPADKVYAQAVRNVRASPGHHRHRAERPAATDPVHQRRADRRASGQRVVRQPVTADDLLGAQRKAAECRDARSLSACSTCARNERGVFEAAEKRATAIARAKKKPRHCLPGLRLYHLGGGK